MVFLAVVVALAPNQIDFQPRPPKAGSFDEFEFNYRMKSAYANDEFHHRLREKVLGVRPDGSYALRRDTLSGYGIVKGVRKKIKPFLHWVWQFDPLGRLIKPDEPRIEKEPMIRVLNGVMRFHNPSRYVKVGDRYGKILNSNDGEGYNDATQQFQAVKMEKWKGQEVMRIAFTYREKFTKVYFEGHWLVRVKDAKRVTFHAIGTDVPYVLNFPAGDVTVSQELVLER
jgi:hypothetical protein